MLNKPSLFLTSSLNVFIIWGRGRRITINNNIASGVRKRTQSFSPFLNISTQHKPYWPIIIKIKKTSKASRKSFSLSCLLAPHVWQRKHRNFIHSLCTNIFSRFLYVILEMFRVEWGRGSGAERTRILPSNKAKENKENSFFILFRGGEGGSEKKALWHNDSDVTNLS